MNKKVEAQKKKVITAIEKLETNLHSLSLEIEKDEDETRAELFATLDEIEDDDVRDPLEQYINRTGGTKASFLALTHTLVELISSIVHEDT